VGTWFLYANGGVVMSLLPHVRCQHPKQLKRVAWGAIGFQGVILLILFAVVVLTVGPYAGAMLHWPIVYVFSLVTVRTFFIKGVGLLITLIWSSALVLYLTVHMFCFGWNLGTVFGPERYRWTVALATLATAAVAIAMPSDVVARALLFNWVNPGDFGWTLVVVSTSWAWTRWRRSNVAVAPKDGTA
jgi:hypothetical protein